MLIIAAVVLPCAAADRIASRAAGDALFLAECCRSREISADAVVASLLLLASSDLLRIRDLPRRPSGPPRGNLQQCHAALVKTSHLEQDSSDHQRVHSLVSGVHVVFLHLPRGQQLGPDGRRKCLCS